MVSQGNSSGIFPIIHHIAAQSRSPRVHFKNERKARKFHWTDHLHVDVQRHLMEISRQGTRMRIKRQPRFYLCGKIFTRKMVGHSSDLDQKRSGILLMIANHKKMGQSCRIEDDKI